jgi:hypothetical protein
LHSHVNRSQVTRPKSYPGVIKTSFELKKKLEEKRELSPHSKISLFFFQNSFYLKSRTVNVNLKTSANKKKPAATCKFLWPTRCQRRLYQSHRAGTWVPVRSRRSHLARSASRTLLFQSLQRTLSVPSIKDFHFSS